MKLSQPGVNALVYLRKNCTAPSFKPTTPGPNRYPDMPINVPNYLNAHDLVKKYLRPPSGVQDTIIVISPLAIMVLDKTFQKQIPSTNLQNSPSKMEVIRVSNAG